MIDEDEEKVIERKLWTLDYQYFNCNIKKNFIS